MGSLPTIGRDSFLELEIRSVLTLSCREDRARSVPAGSIDAPYVDVIAFGTEFSVDGNWP